MPVSGGDLLNMGLTAGPLVAAALQETEREWIAAGFPADKAAVRAMARRHVDQELRSSQ
jgi:poly(A) polymerase